MTIIILMLLFSVLQSNSMELNPATKIISEKDIALFAGKLVAWELTKDIFHKYNPWGNSWSGNYDVKYYTFKNKPETHYGYVEDKGFGSRCKQKYDMLLCGHEYADGLLYNFDDVYVIHRLYKIHHCRNDNSFFHTCFQCDINRIRNDCEAVSTILHPQYFNSECQMRNITPQEAVAILEALRKNKAQFSWWFEKKWTTPTILALLELVKNAS